MAVRATSGTRISEDTDPVIADPILLLQLYDDPEKESVMWDTGEHWSTSGIGLLGYIIYYSSLYPAVRGGGGGWHFNLLSAKHAYTVSPS